MELFAELSVILEPTLQLAFPRKAPDSIHVFHHVRGTFRDPSRVQCRVDDEGVGPHADTGDLPDSRGRGHRDLGKATQLG